jgi:hypothetical protein
VAKDDNQGSDASVLSRLAGRGEDAVTRLMDELGKNPRVTEALAKVMDAKGKADSTTRRTLGQVGLAAADEIREMRGRLEKLENRLSQLEGTGGSPSGQTGRKTTTTTKSSGGTAAKSSSAKSSAAKSSSAKSSSAKSSGTSSSKGKTSGGSGSSSGSRAGGSSRSGGSSRPGSSGSSGS